jgi:hypothetical protein
MVFKRKNKKNPCTSVKHMTEQRKEQKLLHPRQNDASKKGHPRSSKKEHPIYVKHTTEQKKKQTKLESEFNRRKRQEQDWEMSEKTMQTRTTQDLQSPQ